MSQDNLTPDPYDQVILLSQKTINDAFASMYTLADSKSPLRHFDQDPRSMDYLHMDLNAPRVALQATTTDPQLYHMLRIKSGELKLFRSDKQSDKSFDILQTDGWELAFAVKIGRKQVDPSEPEYKEFQKRAGIGEDTFSLAQLYVDSSTTTLWSKEHSTLGKDGAAKLQALTARARGTFDTMVQTWLSTMAEEKCNILGYAIHMKDDELNKYKSSFPATTIDYSVYPWAEDKDGKDRHDGSDKNALCYLMMGEGHAPPKHMELPYTGNYLTDKTDACYCMGSKTLASWLAPVLQSTSRAMTVTPGKGPEEKYVEGGDTPWETTFSVGMGNDQSGGYEVDTSKDAEALHPNLLGLDYGSSASLVGWDCTGAPELIIKTAEDTHNGDTEKVIEQGENVKACVGVGVDTNLIVFNGQSQLFIVVEHEGPKTRSKMTYDVKWIMAFEVNAVTDGGLVIQKFHDSNVVYSRSDGNLHWKDGLKSVEADLKEEVQKALKDQLAVVESSISRAFADQHRLFLPAAGTFSMKNPRFNSKGSLLVDLTYDGDEPPEKP